MQEAKNHRDEWYRCEMAILAAASAPKSLDDDAKGVKAAKICPDQLELDVTCRADQLPPDQLELDVTCRADQLPHDQLEIDENLIRAELTAAQRASAIKRRKALWEQRHGAPAESGKTVSTLSEEPKTGRGHKQFATETAERTGQTKQSINQHVSRAEALGDDLDAVTGTSLDKGVELDALKAMPPEERAPLIERARAGEPVTARKPPAEKHTTREQVLSQGKARRISDQTVEVTFPRCRADQLPHDQLELDVTCRADQLPPPDQLELDVT
ncbi:hypothetical protein [Halomonas sp.]|uniref:hypothetical protein n=1 Tax=Halomonas sp. TaxID=1486246 RepID=UPI00298D6320|nr:hypothetical protein [Halomonas sp.]MDW7748167.1 hypothetical protein [Halomonas sp.]